MKPNADLTIYVKSIDPDTRTEVWTRQQVRGVFWEDAKAVNVTKSGLLEADRVTVYIPLGRAIDLKAGDVIVRGLVEDEISPSFTITALRAKYPASATVRSVDRWDRGSPRVRHVQIGAS